MYRCVNQGIGQQMPGGDKRVGGGGSTCCRDILGGIIGHGDLMSDTIHPNEQGYGIIADRLEPVLRELLSDE
jgi:lysophospholipase L1-like esterase